MSNRIGEKTEFGPGKTALYYNNVGLFSDPFLEDRLPNLEKYYNHPSTRFLNEYWNIDESDPQQYNDAFQSVMDLWNKLDQNVPKFCAKERQLQNSWIDRIFEYLGWTIELEETSSKNGVTNYPDYALFASVEDWKKSKSLTGNNKFKKAIAVADAKDWGVNLDGKGFSNKNPSFQIINYLKQTDKNWGILTDGKYWRIYSLRSDSKHTTFYEIDLEKILASGDYQRFKYFYNFFRVDAFVLDSKLGDRSFLDLVFEDGKFYSQTVEKNLSDRVYKVVSSICQGFLVNYTSPSEQDLKEVYENSMYYLFKLMFVLNCESKGLLEVNKQDDYYESSLRKKCLEVKEQFEQGKNWSSQPRTYNYISDLFNLLKNGDEKIGVHGFGDEPFEIGSQKFYSKNKIGDEFINNALIELSCDKDEEGSLQFIDYKILSPDHLGSLFEGLLEFGLVKSGKKVELVNSKGDRKLTGSYYTPDHLVDLIVEHTVKPLIKDKDTAELLKLRIIDPAMGSGHFLLGSVKFIEEAVIRFQDRDEKKKSFVDFDKLRKEVIKNCIYGIDVNPLATELAKFSLWIYSSQKGDFLEPLSDQLKCGDSLTPWPLKEKFDAVVGNPPYVNAVILSNDQSYKEKIKERFSSAEGAFDIASLFFEAAKNHSPESRVGFIIPNKLLSAKHAKGMRRFLFENPKCGLEIVEDLTTVPVFKDASVYPVILVFGNKKFGQALVRRHDKLYNETNVFEKKKIGKRPDSFLQELISQSDISTEGNSVTLGSICNMFGSATVAEAYEFKKAVSEKKSIRSQKFIVSGNIINFGTTWKIESTQYIKAAYNGPFLDLNNRVVSEKRRTQYTSQKIVMANMTTVLKAFFDERGEYAPGKSTTILYSEKVPNKALAAYLNSKVATTIYRGKFDSLKMNGGALRIGPPQLKDLEVPLSLVENTKVQKELISLYDSIKKAIELEIEEKIDLKTIRKSLEGTSVGSKKIALLKGKLDDLCDSLWRDKVSKEKVS